MTPYQLDCLISGAKVFIYRRPDGTVYASTSDFERFGVKALEIVRVPLHENSTIESVENSPEVIKRVSALTPADRTKA